MFRTKANLQAWLNIIRPWAMGVENRGWRREDFETEQPLTADEMDRPDRPIGVTTKLVAIEDVKEHRTDLSHVIFPLLSYDVTVLDRLFLSQELLNEVAFMNQKIAAFNEVLRLVNDTEDKDTKWQRTVMLHAGTIGTYMGFGIFWQFKNLEAVLNG